MIKPEQLSAAIRKKIEDANKKTSKTWAKRGSVILKKEINEHLDAGLSPVAGSGDGKPKFKQYSKEYADREKGGTRKPVNLIKSGAMRRSLQVTPTKANNIQAKFTSPINKYHNDLGAGKSKIKRRTLPIGKEKFKRVINQALTALYVKLYRL